MSDIRWYGIAGLAWRKQQFASDWLGFSVSIPAVIRPILPSILYTMFMPVKSDI